MIEVELCLRYGREYKVNPPTVSQCLLPASESELLLICLLLICFGCKNFALICLELNTRHNGGIAKASNSSSKSLTSKSSPIITIELKQG